MYIKEKHVNLFTTIFWLAIVVGAFGGLINAIIQTVKSVDDDKFKLSKTFAWFIRDLVTGIGASFGVYMLSQAMNNDAGILIASFIAGLGGVVAINQLRRSQGYRDERDLLVQSKVAENDIIEPLKTELQTTKAELERISIQLVQAQAKLDARQQNKELYNELTDLKERLKDAEAKLSDDSRYNDENASTDVDENQQGNRKNRRR